MGKTYKLIKGYPNSPDLGTILYDKNDTLKYFPDYWKEYLLTTKDGVSIFEGDTFWVLNASFDISCTNDITPLIGYKTLFFSTENAAKDYKINNENRYSISDVEEVLKKLGYHPRNRQGVIKSLLKVAE